MTFEPIHLYPMSVFFTVGVMLGLPTLVLAIRRQSADRVLRRQLLLVATILVVGASVYTLAAFHVIGPTAELLGLGLLWFLAALCAAVLAFLLVRLAGRGRNPA